MRYKLALIALILSCCALAAQDFPSRVFKNGESVVDLPGVKLVVNQYKLSGTLITALEFFLTLDSTKANYAVITIGYEDNCSVCSGGKMLRFVEAVSPIPANGIAVGISPRESVPLEKVRIIKMLLLTEWSLYEAR